MTAAAARAQSGIYFNESAADRVLLGNGAYEVAFSKTNGGILYILDKASGGNVSTGSRGGCLWGSNPNYFGGCSFSSTGASRFSYVWNSTQNVLTLNYQHNPAASTYMDAAVTVAPGAGNFFDLSIIIQNHQGYTIQSVLFPSDTIFLTDTLQYGYLPMQLPGVRLKPAFFQGATTQLSTYPGKPNFADYVALDSGAGRIAMYGVNPSGPVQPVQSGFYHYSGDAADQYVMSHNFRTWIPNGSTFSSPTVRIWVGKGPSDTAVAYRNDNGIANYPSISSKLGSRFAQMAQSPLVKTDLEQIGLTFSALSAQFASVSGPILFHPVSYWPLGFDRDYPDFLPPNAAYGTTNDFATFVTAAHTANFLVMPYTNPTWWKPESPTMQNLPSPLTAASIAVQGQNGTAVTETYNPVNGTGYPVSPWHPFVRQRWSQLMTGWQTQVPMDFVFTDQIGSRSWEYDFNPSEPDPMSFSAGWLNWWQTYPLLGTEDGWDRLASAGFGFFGTALTGATSFHYTTQRYGIGSNGNNLLGIGTWDPYPLATWMFHDKILFYQHDLDENATTENDEVVTYNLAFGNNLGYLWPLQKNAPVTAPRVALGNALQRLLGPRYAGQPISSYTYLQTDVAATVFGSLTIIANWQQTANYTTSDGYTIMPAGYLARTADGAVLAGSFTGQFNGAAITAATHHIQTSLGGKTITVRQPVGADTSLSVSMPPGWAATDAITVKPLNAAGTALTAASFTISSGKITFNYTGTVGTTAVEHYEITDTSPLSLPVAPVLLAPANGSQQPPTGPTLVWSASSGAASYDIYLGTAAPPPFYANTAATSYLLPGLNPGTTYYWYVVAKNAAGNAAVLTTWSFKTTDSPVIQSVVNGASFHPGFTAASWVTITGTDLANTNPGRTWMASEIVNGNLPTALDGVSVTIDQKPAYVYYISPRQINVQAPSDSATGSVNVIVTNSGAVSAAFTATLQTYSPAFFQYSGTSFAIATRYPDNALVGDPGAIPGTVAAKAGDVLTLWATGLGATTPAIPAGVEVTGGPTVTGPIFVTIGGVPAMLIGAALSPGSAGLYQIAVQVPQLSGSGAVEVSATIGSVTSPAGTTLFVAAP